MKNYLPPFYTIAVFAFVFYLSPNSTFAQVSVDQSLTIEEYVEILLGDGITATNISFNGQGTTGVDSVGIGAFLAENTAFPIAEGITLATDNAINVLTGVFDWQSILTEFENDPDLMAISGQNMNDCQILEFDFVATTDTFLIDYVFASTEYQAYTCSNFNDAFGIFLSGPGIEGPFTNNAKNIALIPSTEIPVAVNTVNGGAPTGGGIPENCLAVNPNFVEDSIYFFNNTPQLENSIVLNGHTHMFTAFAELEVGQEYHFKFAIGNAADGALDSAVLMRKGSLSGESDINGITVQVNTENIDVEPDGLFVAGTWNYFQPEPMVQVSENVFAFTAMLPADMNISYKFFNGNGANASELVPADCSVESLMPDGSRNLTTTDEPIVLDPVCFGTCETCTEFLSVDNVRPESINVFPNPSSGEFQLQSPSEGFARVQAFNIVGSMVMDERVFLNSGENYVYEIEESGLYKMLVSFERGGAIFQTTVVVE